MQDTTPHRAPTDRQRYFVAGGLLAIVAGGLHAAGLVTVGEAFPLLVVLPMSVLAFGGAWPMLLVGWGGLLIGTGIAFSMGVEFSTVSTVRHTVIFLTLPVFAVVGEILRRNRLTAESQRAQVEGAYAELREMYGKLEAALDEQRTRRNQLEVITTSVPGVIFQYVVRREMQHGFAYVSSNVYDVFSLSPDALLHDASLAWRCIHRDDRRSVREQLKRAMMSRTPWDQEFRIVHPSAPRDIRWIAVHAVPRLDTESGTLVWTGIVSPADQRRELQDRLWKAQRLEGIGVLAGGIAHDFNNVLTAVIAEVDLLAADHGDKPDVREALAHIRTAAESGATLSRHLLGFAGRAVNAPEVLPIDHLVARAAPLLRRLLREQIRLEIDVSPGLGNVRIDPGLFDQVLMNLANNARDAMNGTGTVRIRALRHDTNRPAYFAALPDGELIEIIITDTGPGMPESVRERAFEPFFTTKSVGQGTGLGLATSHGIVQQAEGAMFIDPAGAQGCTIRFALPVSSAEAVTPQLLPSPMINGTETLLVVDDEHQVRRVTTETLRRRGYRVLEAASAADALRLARKADVRIDLMITDVVMPDMDGVQLATIMKREQLTRGVLFVSGYAVESMEAHGIDSADIDLIAKPYQVETLAARVRHRLDTLPVS